MCVDVFMRRCLYTLYVVLVETRYVTWILKKIWLDVNSKCHAESDLIVHVLKFRWLSLFWCWVFRTGNKIKIQQQMFMQKNKKHTNTNGGLVHNSPFIKSQSQSKKKNKGKIDYPAFTTFTVCEKDTIISFKAKMPKISRMGTWKTRQKAAM